MKQHTKDVYVIPIVIGVVLLFAGLPLSAWYTKQPVRTIATWAGIKDDLLAKVSAWTDTVLLLTLTVMGYLLYRTYERFKEAQRESDARHATNLMLVEHMQEKERAQSCAPNHPEQWAEDPRGLEQSAEYLGPRRVWDRAMYADWWMGTHQRQRCPRGNLNY